MFNLRLSCLLIMCSFVVFAKSATIEFTKVVCELLDKDFITKSICRLNKTKNNAMVFQFYAETTQKNVNNVTISAKLFNKVNKNYRKFLYDDVIDFCDFQKNIKRHRYWKAIFRRLQENSNVNHTCPLDDTIIIDNLRLQKNDLKYVPLPRGPYMTQFIIATYNVFRFKIELYATVK